MNGFHFRNTIIPGVLVILCGLVSEAVAAEPSGFTRVHWDLIMRWVNFLILMAVVIKYGRAPIKNFLNSKQAEVAREIDQLEDQKRNLENNLKESRLQLEAGRERLALVREKIIGEGHRRKEELIAEAEQQSRYLMASAQLKIDARLRESSRRFRVELVDMAFDMAAAKLPRVLEAQDHERFIADWMAAAAK